MNLAKEIQLTIILGLITKMCYANFNHILGNDCQENYCYDLDELKTHRSQLGTKTSYPHYTDFNINREFNVDNCHPVKMWILVRHGARGPTNGEMNKFTRLLYIHDQFLKNYRNEKSLQHKCSFCDADIRLLKNWAFKKNITDFEANQLQPQGFIDMIKLSKNFQKMFPTLFHPEYSAKKYLFLFAQESRTRDSYQGFVEGLFGTGAVSYIKPRHTNNDEMLLKAYEHCKDSVKNSDRVDEAEPDKFEKSMEFTQVLRDVSFKLGFEKPLNMSLFKKIWDWCGYEQSWFVDRPSPWCAVFSPSHYPLLDYREDISYYYKKSYGSNVNLKLACHTINDMLYHLDNNDTFKVVTYFVHSTLMQLFLTGLDAFKDSEHLRADNFHRMHNRQFRSSAILPLSSNLGVIKYECDNTTEKHQILFLLNQKPIRFDWCDNDRFLCSLSSVKQKYAHFAALDCTRTYCDPNFTGFHYTSNGHTVGNYLPIIIFAGIILKNIIEVSF